MRHLVVTSVMLFLAVGGCTDADDSGEADVAEEALVLPAEVSQISSPPTIGIPWLLAANEAGLWVNDAAGDPYVHLIDGSSGEPVRSFGRKGEGPQDVRSNLAGLQAIAWDPHAIWGDAGRLYRFEDQGPDSVGVRSIELRSPRQIMRAQWIGPNRVVGLTTLDSTRFVFFDSTGVAVGSAPGPYLGSDSVSMLARREASTSSTHVCVPPSGGRYVVYYYGSSQVEIRDADGRLETYADVPLPYEAQFVWDDERDRFRYAEGRINYVSCGVTDERLYLLYSGRESGDGLEGAPTSGTEVHVFDWSGALVGRIGLSQPLRGIAVTSDDRIGYGVSEETAGVYQWRIPEMRRMIAAVGALLNNGLLLSAEQPRRREQHR